MAEASGRVGASLDVLHLDMDAFFAAVEVRADPALAGRPVIVGGSGGRAVVASASYEARAFGIHAAMPMAEARRRCPHAVCIPGRHGEYARTSAALREILESVTPIVEPVALDEAYLDLSGAHRVFGSSAEIAGQLRRRVRAELGLTCSVGVGRTKLVAKLASEAAKPRVAGDGVRPGRGVVAVGPDEELAFLHAHRAGALPGVGPKSAERLRRLGVLTVRDVAELGRARLEALFGRAQGRELDDLAWGRDRRRVVPERATRSIGHEETFERDVTDRADLESRAREIGVSLAARCRASGMLGRTLAVKVRFADFRTITRSRTGDAGYLTGAELGQAACELLLGVDVSPGIRLLGLHASNLVPAQRLTATQPSLFDAEEADGGREARARRHELEAATDEIRRRFGPGAIASLAANARRERPER